MTCPRCGAGDRQVLVTTLEEIDDRYICGACGAIHRAVRFLWFGARIIPELAMDPVTLIWSGPPAPEPRVPSPEDILKSVGLDPFHPLR